MTISVPLLHHSLFLLTSIGLKSHPQSIYSDPEVLGWIWSLALFTGIFFPTVLQIHTLYFPFTKEMYTQNCLWFSGYIEVSLQAVVLSLQYSLISWFPTEVESRKFPVAGPGFTPLASVLAADSKISPSLSQAVLCGFLGKCFSCYCLLHEQNIGAFHF